MFLLCVCVLYYLQNIACLTELILLKHSESNHYLNTDNYKKKNFWNQSDIWLPEQSDFGKHKAVYNSLITDNKIKFIVLVSERHPQNAL